MNCYQMFRLRCPVSGRDTSHFAGVEQEPPRCKQEPHEHEKVDINTAAVREGLQELRKNVQQAVQDMKNPAPSAEPSRMERVKNFFKKPDVSSLPSCLQ